LSKKHDELKLRHRNLEREKQQDKRRNGELLEENSRLREKIQDLEAQNFNLLHPHQNMDSGTHLNSIEETKIDDNELYSLRLAMRFEAENLLMNRLSQIAALQMLYERPEPTHDINNLENINPDNMTYEELLQLEERIGKVSRGLTIEDIKKIPKLVYKKKPHQTEETCSICFTEVEVGVKVRKLPCCHEYHSKCIKQWLVNEKSCPICKKEVVISN